MEKIRINVYDGVDGQPAVPFLKEGDQIKYNGRYAIVRSYKGDHSCNGCLFSDLFDGGCHVETKSCSEIMRPDVTNVRFEEINQCGGADDSMRYGITCNLTELFGAFVPQEYLPVLKDAVRSCIEEELGDRCENRRFIMRVSVLVMIMATFGKKEGRPVLFTSLGEVYLDVLDETGRGVLLKLVQIAMDVILVYKDQTI